MSTKHTPGPWFVHDFRELGGCISISCVTPDHITVTDIIGTGLTNTDAEKLANAELIARAPMLEQQCAALREAIREHRRNVWGDGAVEHDEDRDLYAVLESLAM